MHLTATRVSGFGAKHAFSPLALIEVELRDVGPGDVAIDVLYCGMCHSDLQLIRNSWKNTIYPCVPGHEIVGKIAEVGSRVTQFKVGDTVGVGWLIDSCGECPNCRGDLEQFCEGPIGATLTCNGPVKPNGTNTHGGYAQRVVVAEGFVLRIPKSLPLPEAAPILGAGVAAFSPLKHWHVGLGQHVGVVGIGGLGHLALKLASALGATVTAISSSPRKESDARRFGAKDFLSSRDAEAMLKYERTFDFILDTIPVPHDANPYLRLLKRDGTLVVCGMLSSFSKSPDTELLTSHRRSIAGTFCGSIMETQEALDFCAKHHLAAEVELVPGEEINGAFKRLETGEVRYRPVLEMAKAGAAL